MTLRPQSGREDSTASRIQLSQLHKIHEPRQAEMLWTDPQGNPRATPGLVRRCGAVCRQRHRIGSAAGIMQLQREALSQDAKISE
jgi:hypothetical protein